MTALLLKDFFTLFKQTKIFLVLIVVFALIPGTSISAMAVIYAAMLPLTALAYDERAKWDTLAAMMPYSTKDLVMSKYVLGYIGIIASSLLSFVAQFLSAIIRHTPLDDNMAFSVFFIACIGVIVLDFNLPLMFRLGVEKGRIAFYIVIGAIVAISVMFLDKAENLFSESTSQLWLLCGVLVFAAVLSCISIPLSIKWYKKRG